MSSSTRDRFDPGGVADYRHATWHRLDQLQPEHLLYRGGKCLRQIYDHYVHQSYLQGLREFHCCPPGQEGNPSSNTGCCCPGGNKQHCLQPCTKQYNLLLFQGGQGDSNIGCSSNFHHHHQQPQNHQHNHNYHHPHPNDSRPVVNQLHHNHHQQQPPLLLQQHQQPRLQLQGYHNTQQQQQQQQLQYPNHPFHNCPRSIHPQFFLQNTNSTNSPLANYQYQNIAQHELHQNQLKTQLADRFQDLPFQQQNQQYNHHQQQLPSYHNHKRKEIELRLQRQSQSHHHHPHQVAPYQKSTTTMMHSGGRGAAATAMMNSNPTKKTVYRGGLEYCVLPYSAHPHDPDVGTDVCEIKKDCPPALPRDIMEPRHYELTSLTWKGVPLPFSDSRYELLLPGNRESTSLLPSSNPFVYVGRKSNWTEPRIGNPPLTRIPITARRSEVFGDGTGVAVTTNRLGYRPQRRHYPEHLSMIVYN